MQVRPDPDLRRKAANITLALAWSLSALGCAAMPFSGLSVEGSVGQSWLQFEKEALPPATSSFWGLSLSLDVDWLRSSSLGVGAEYRQTQVPGAPDVHSAWAARYTMGSLVHLPRNDWFRPRTVLAAATGSGSDSWREVFWGAGFSLHPIQGLSLHVQGGPHYGFISGSSLDRANGSGPGWQVRLRLLKMFFSDCDVAPDDDAGGSIDGGDC